MLYYKGTGHLKESGYQGASGPWGTEETRAQRTPKATSLHLCLCSIPLSLSETGSPCVLGSIASNFQVDLASIQETSRISLDSSGPNAELSWRFCLDQLEAGVCPGPVREARGSGITAACFLARQAREEAGGSLPWASTKALK